MSWHKVFIWSFFVLQCCACKLVAQENHAYTNDLIHEKSEYLLQHAHNPVNWLPWGEKAFERAKKEDKLVIISIGYSSCHWCHVMEKETFENEKIANYMNEHFVCIKVDREERTDVDKMYMSAVSLINKNTGWPLNCFALQDGRPFFGGTYYPPNEWLQMLESIQQTQTEMPEKIIEFADNLTEGISENQFVPIDTNEVNFTKLDIIKSVNGFSSLLDYEKGGIQSDQNKFPMSSMNTLLLNYIALNSDSIVKKYTLNTLDKMMQGGIYDQVGGGFARYSTDENWKVPHFEKMLYINAQMLSNYSEAYKISNNEEYRRIVSQTVEWLQREMTDTKGRFYASQDADSEGEEGLFYTWTKAELKSILGDDYEWVKNYFEINPMGIFEKDKYILYRSGSDVEFARSQNWTLELLNENLNRSITALQRKRDQRIKPFTDKKTITSWNALMVSGLVDAYKTFGEKRYLEMAETNMVALLQIESSKSNKIHHLMNGSESAFLDDYAFTIKALIDLYQVTFNESYLNLANDYSIVAIKEFKDDNSPYFYYSMKDERVSFRTIELQDLSIPSSNAVMAENLFLIGKYFENDVFIEVSKDMCANMKKSFISYGTNFAYWGKVIQYFTNPFYEVAIVGDDSQEIHKELMKNVIPNTILLGGQSTLPLLKEKTNVSVPTIYVCKEKVCQKPVSTISEALELMPR